MKKLFETTVGTVLFFAVSILPFAGFIQHIVTCVDEDRTLLLIAGIFIFPIGIVHGWGVWLGVW